MADKQGHYWDHEQCGWVRCPAPIHITGPAMDIPEQAAPESRAVEAEQEADVRSG
jgi:hypothetical protein